MMKKKIEQTTMTRFCSLLTFPVPPTYLPHLVNVVCERPPNFLRMKKEIITLGKNIGNSGHSGTRGMYIQLGISSFRCY